MNWILNPEDGHVQKHVPHGATADAGDDGKPHEAHDVHALPRRDQCSGHGEHDGREDVEEMDQAEQVLRIDQGGLHKRCGVDPPQYPTGPAVAMEEEFGTSS